MSTDDWWRTAVVYQVYLRSFTDGDGDGVGDIAGLRSRLDHISALGADAFWVSPWYPSPMVDAGYDVRDPRGIDPLFGTLAEAEALLAEAHAAGLRVFLDIVPNHTSSSAPKFQAALAGDPEARLRYHFLPGRGEHGELPPNNWTSGFGGPAWTRVDNPDGSPGDWYLHWYAAAQPDLNWDHPAVGADFDQTLRFWFDRGVDGFRIDSANGLVKAPGLPDFDPSKHTGHPAWDQEGVHDIYRRWRRIADSYDPPRVFVAEAWFDDPERLARYLRPDELHTAFQAALIEAPFRTEGLRSAIEKSPVAAESVGAPPTWVLSNHDTVRHRTRYARSQPDRPEPSAWDRLRWPSEEPDLVLGLARARAAALLLLALPGTIYLFQGDELGLEEVEDIPIAERQDPTWEQSGHTDVGRDGCRVPLPWSGDHSPFGFTRTTSAAGSATAGTTKPPWLPQPARWTDRTVAAETADPDSTWSLYREALRLRAGAIGPTDTVDWLDAGPALLAWRTGGLTCLVNAGRDPVVVPEGLDLSGLTVVLRSDPHQAGDQDGPVPGSGAIWFARPEG